MFYVNEKAFQVIVENQNLVTVLIKYVLSIAMEYDKPYKFVREFVL